MSATRGSSRSLRPYRQKRDFFDTPEPVGHKAEPPRKKKGLAFCVQKHWAGRLHYDLRLEYNGVLLSWAVPKGPSRDPADKRLAVQTEDHPLEYADFEGVISSGYGAGVMMLWDRGTWQPDHAGGSQADMDAALRQGQLEFHLHGKKLRGGWVLVRSSSRVAAPDQRQNQWLLIKHRDDGAIEGEDLSRENRSVKSRLGLEGIMKKHPQESQRLLQQAPQRIEKALVAERVAKSDGRARKTTKKTSTAKGAAAKATAKTTKAPRPPETILVQVGSRELRLSNLDKVLFPKTGATKAQILDYYARVAPTILPHLHDRPVTLKRFPEGVEGGFFYEKNCPTHRPKWMTTVPVRSERRGTINFCVLEDQASLIWAVNLASFELHTYLHRVSNIQEPTMIAMDLDPGTPAGLRECAKVALLIRDELERLGLQTFAKASGGKGLHLYVPLNTPVTYEQTRAVAQTLASHFARAHPHRITDNMRKALRTGKVLIDWSQNHDHKTTVCAYSMRAQPAPSISLPLKWEEIETISRWRTAKKLDTTPERALKRIEEMGDLFAPVLELEQRLPGV